MAHHVMETGLGDGELGAVAAESVTQCCGTLEIDITEIPMVLLKTRDFMDFKVVIDLYRLKTRLRMHSLNCYFVA